MDLSKMQGRDPNIENLLRQAPQQQQQVIDPVTPILLDKLVRNSEEFAVGLVRFCFYGRGDHDIFITPLFDLCFSCLRPLPSSMPIESIRSIFFNLYFAQCHGAVFDYILSRDETEPKYNISEKGIKAFSAAYTKLTDRLYTYFVKNKKAGGTDFIEFLEDFASQIRD